MKWLPAIVVAATIANTACNACGPEQHAITTSANTLMLGGDIAARQIQFVNRRLTEPPASHEVFQFLFNTLEGSTNGQCKDGDRRRAGEHGQIRGVVQLTSHCQ
jgi:hypothetical protein